MNRKLVKDALLGAIGGLAGTVVIAKTTGLLTRFKLSPPATEFPVSTHLRDLTTNYSYAATAECVCSTLEALNRAVAPTEHAPRTKRELREVS